MATRGKMERQMEQQLVVVEKYYLDEINMINTRHTTRIKKLDGQMVVSCPVATVITVMHPPMSLLLFTNTEHASRSQSCERERRQIENKTQECAYHSPEQSRQGYEV